ncbi:transposase [Streptomyces sp. NBC_01304]|uniref:transposase n=1 Tax=Streptomyces sp. NBC_01304 TaxID=2903818 RepID=UPI002E15934C|nr:transposase [Streptomyces sp. NBC_01304]
MVTTPATVQDMEVTARIHADLDNRGLLPAEHLVDTACMDAQLVVAARAYGTEMFGPVRTDTTWQSANNGYTVDDFNIDWEHHQLTCPNGRTSPPWRETQRRGDPMIRVQFSALDCIPCPLRSRCTHSARYRQLTLLPKAEHEALGRLREEQTTTAREERYTVVHNPSGS